MQAKVLENYQNNESFIINFAPVVQKLGSGSSLAHLFDVTNDLIMEAMKKKLDSKEPKVMEELDSFLFVTDGLKVLKNYFNSSYSNQIVIDDFKPENNDNIRQMIYAFADIEDIENAKSDITTLLLAYLESETCSLSNQKERTDIAYSINNVLYMLQGAKSYKEEGKEEKFEKF